MRTLLIALILAVLGVSATAQGNKPTFEQLTKQRQLAEKTATLLRELAQFEYKAQQDIPAVDDIFVEDGKLVAATYHSALRQGGIAVKAGQVTKVSPGQTAGLRPADFLR